MVKEEVTEKTKLTSLGPINSVRDHRWGGSSPAKKKRLRTKEGKRHHIEGKAGEGGTVRKERSFGGVLQFSKGAYVDTAYPTRVGS